jgi:hypothetical protein
MRYKVHTAMKMSMLVLWVVTPCELVGRYQCLAGTYCLFSPEDGGSIFLRNIGICLQNPHGVTTQKSNIEIISNVSNELKLPR